MFFRMLSFTDPVSEDGLGSQIGKEMMPMKSKQRGPRGDGVMKIKLLILKLCNELVGSDLQHQGPCKYNRDACVLDLQDKRDRRVKYVMR